MYLYNNTLYTSCYQLYSYDLSNFPSVVEKQLPFPNVEIKEIYQADEIVAFVGRNSFSVMYLNRLVNYYEDGNLDRLIFNKDMFVSASESGVDIGKIKIIKPYITCNTQDAQFLGLSKMQFKTLAECNETYFEQYQVNMSTIEEIGPGDICVYTVFRPINYWQVGEIKPMPYIIFGLVIVALVVVTLIICFVKNLKIKRIQSLLDEYVSTNNSESAKHQKF